ncbi:MAG: outer membrane protein assembly factor BamA [Thermodesulfobacteriota bacterium]
MQINKRNSIAVLSLAGLVVLLTFYLYPNLGQASSVERITLDDALNWEVAQAETEPQNTEIEEEGDLSATNNNIVQIKVEGNRRVEKELIELNINSQVGQTLSTASVREDVKKIYGLGSFEDVTAEIDRTPNGIILVYKVKEKPIVADLRIRGNDDIKSKDILEVVTVREGKIIDLNNVKKTQEIIGQLYAEAGLVGTVVDYEIEPEGDGTVSVTYDIKEGKKAYIKEVNFVGNEQLKTKVVKKGIYSKPKGIFSFLTKKGLYNPREILNDSERIRTTYIDNGFLDVKVSKPEIEYSDEKKGYIVTFKISEGDQFTVNELSFAGELIVPEEELREVLSLKSGEIFRGSLLARDISGLTTFYGNQGFAFANAEPQFAVDRQNQTVDIRFSMEKGPEVYIREIDIVGNYRTRDKVIRREIPIQEQQLYNASEVQAIRPRVTRLGFFEENVEVVSERVPGQEDKLDLEVRVEEKSTGFFSVAGGFSSIETFIFAGQIQESNLFGYGKRISLNAQIGGVTQLFFINYGDPNFWDSDYTLDATLFRTDRTFRDFDRSSWGGRITFGRRIWRWLELDVSYRLENVKISGIDDNARLILTSEDQTISAIGIGAKWDSRNNLLDPSKGNLSRMIIESAGGPTGGNVDYIKYTISSRQWFRLWFNTVFTVRGRYGIIDFRNTGNDLVVAERFFLGGPNSLRGFGFRRVGPRVPTEDGNFVIIGGVQEVLFSADYVFPIIPSAGLRGVLFVDSGNAFNDGEDLSLNPSDLRNDVGFGFRWISPLGPLRLEIGIPLGDRLPGENSYEIQFTVGTLF